MKYKGDESLPRAARPAKECFVHDDRGQTGDERIPQSGSKHFAKPPVAKYYDDMAKTKRKHDTKTRRNIGII